MLLCSSYLSAQKYGHSTELSIGYVQDGIGIFFGYNVNLNEKSKILINLGSSFSEQKSEFTKVKFDVYQLKAQYLEQIYASRRDGFKLLLGGGIVAGYEDVRINNKRNLENRGFKPTNDSNFIYGPMVSIEADMFLSRISSAFVIASQQFQINSDVGEFIPYLGIGYRYKLD